MAQAALLPPTRQNIKIAADLILAGGVVAYPTETVYGLGVDPANEAALARLFSIKGRPADQPVLLLVAERSQLSDLASSVSSLASDLMDRFWPGPLTLILPARNGLSNYVTTGSNTVAVRQASPGVAADLLDQTDIPITSTSANRTGERPAVTSTQVAALLPENDALALDGQCTPDALPSTLVDVTGHHPRVIRDGAIPKADILKQK